jgi:hypothetical protein
MVIAPLSWALWLGLKNTFKPFDRKIFAIVPHRKNYFYSVLSFNNCFQKVGKRFVYFGLFKDERLDVVITFIQNVRF